MGTTRAAPALQVIGPYAILAKVGEGSFGAVYKARHPKTGAIVAIKVITPMEDTDPILIKRFEQEFRSARRCNHPNLVRGLAFGRDGASYYLVMEFVDGPSLGDRIERDKRLSEDEAVPLVVQIAQGLHHAHQQGIIHRDVKPDNILIGPNGQAKLTDLGLGKDIETDGTLTRPSTGLGTPYFMAPEQFQDAKHVDVRCDIYSLGATLYMAVTGTLPFSQRIGGSLKKKLSDDLKPPRQLVPGLSEQVELAIRRSVRAAPEQRFATCLEFIEALTGRSTPEAVPVRQEIASRRGVPVKRLESRRIERRLEVRFPSRLKGACRAVGGDQDVSWMAQVKDISASGIGLLLPRRFERGTVLAVEWPQPKANRPRRLLLRVVRVQALSRGQWLVGCTFASRLSEDEVEDLR